MHGIRVLNTYSYIEQSMCHTTMLITVAILSCSLTSTLGYGQPVVELSSGTVQGFSDESSACHTRYYGFLAIPYAEPPVGKLRFQPPQTFGRWIGVLNGSQLGPICPQWDVANQILIGEEDCLVLNVYVQQHPNLSEISLPVLLYIHGGAFLADSGRYDHYGPQNFMDFPVVLVTINYRLGVLGFLSTNDSSAYGNYGMLDQVLAMKWVQDNIRHFGGDENRVTIFGNSAGSASVIYHLISPLSKGLFSRAISQSGTALNYWALQRDPLHFAKMIATRLKCTWNNTVDIVQCLSNKNVEELIYAESQMKVAPVFPINCAPSVEPPGGPGFLTETPMSLIKHNRISNRVPVIIGHTTLEGYELHWNLVPSFKYNGSQYFEKQFPGLLPLFTPIQPYMTAAIEAVADQYYRDVNLDNETVFTYVLSQILGDAIVTAGVSETANLLSEAGLPVYAYIYSYIHKQEMFSTHADELTVQFRMKSSIQSTMDFNDTAMSYVINSHWVTFAYQISECGTIDHLWPLYVQSDPVYVYLNLTPVIKHGPLSNETDFWTQTIPRLIGNYTIIK